MSRPQPLGYRVAIYLAFAGFAASVVALAQLLLTGPVRLPDWLVP